MNRLRFRVSVWSALPFVSLPVLRAQDAEEPPAASAPSEPAAGEPEAAPTEAEAPPPAPVDAAKQTPTALFADFMHFARLGKFQEARSFASALLAHPDLDAVNLLEVADKDRRSFDTLVTIINNSSIGEEAKRVLAVLREGEARKARDPERVNLNIDKLGGPPHGEHNAIQLLARSGENAVPWMVQALMDPARESLRTRIVRALPKLGQPAVIPLAIALDAPDLDVRKNVIRALGEIGYPQAIPYLKKLSADSKTADDLRVAAGEALAEIAHRAGRSFPAGPADDFVQLGEQYYREEGSLRADPRNDAANVWYWRDNFLTAVSVPREVFGAVMAMRCAEEALRLQPAKAEAISLWLAANIRREGRLGMDVESGEAAEGAADASRPEGFPRALFFTRAAGPRYAQSVLERAVADRDARVALGAIAALRAVAGEAALVGFHETQQPLVKALDFPDALVRVRAALALAEARPKTQFAGSERVGPVLGEALAQSGSATYVVIEPDDANLNRIMEALRQSGARVVGDADFHRAMDRARTEFKSVTGVLLSMRLISPSPARALEELRREGLFAAAPVVLLETDAAREAIKAIEERDSRVSHAAANATDAELAEAMSGLLRRTGQSAITSDLALSLALEAADALRGLAEDGRSSLSIAAAEPALMAGLEGAGDEGLRVRIAGVLAYSRSQAAQRTLATVALDAAQSEPLRVAVFASLAGSAKLHGNQLLESQVSQLVGFTAEEANLTLRTAASQALGALNLSNNQGSDLIRRHYRG